MKHVFAFLLLLGCVSLNAQQIIPLDRMDAFRPQAGNWSIVGGVETHPFEHADSQEDKGRKRRRRKSAGAQTSGHEAPLMQTTPGTGILLNMNEEKKKDALLTTWEHGDILLELEVMLPKGSNSGIYLQGRYEVQLLDSWGVRDPRFSDIGGIYRNWIEEPERKFMGVAPLSNPSRAPGLWQRMKIHFRAPRFNETGAKTENARFVLVELNGVPIHENVEVPRPTGGPISDEEVARGPLMIQGDHGPVAFRNIRYTLYEPSAVRVSELAYQTFEGPFDALAELDGKEAVYTGETRQIEVGVVGAENNYGLIYEGFLDIPADDTYTLSLGFTGGARLILNGRTLIEHNSAWDHGVLDHSLRLEAGSYPLRIEHIKSAGWYGPRLGLWVSSPNTEPKAFHSEESFSRLSYVVPRIGVEPGARPRMHRGFVRFAGDGELLSHTMAVGTPEGIHYVYDLNKGQVVGMWRGDFVDATPMWRDRGDGSFDLLGAVNWTFPGQPLLAPGDRSEDFTSKHRNEDFRSHGYRIDPGNGLPVYHYDYCDWSVTHRVLPSADRRYIRQELAFERTAEKSPPTSEQITRTDSSYVYTLAQGTIQAIDERTFRVNDAYYLRIVSGPQAFERTTQLGTELCVPVTGPDLQFETYW